MGDIPEKEEDLIKSVLNDETARFNSADLNVAYKMDVAEYQRLCPYAEALEENWGKPPGEDPVPHLAAAADAAAAACSVTHGTRCHLVERLLLSMYKGTQLEWSSESVQVARSIRVHCFSYSVFGTVFGLKKTTSVVDAAECT